MTNGFFSGCVIILSSFTFSCKHYFVLLFRFDASTYKDVTDTPRWCAKRPKPLITSRRTLNDSSRTQVRPTFQKHLQTQITNAVYRNDRQGKGREEHTPTTFSTFISIHYFVTPFHIIIIIDWKGAGALTIVILVSVLFHMTLFYRLLDQIFFSLYSPFSLSYIPARKREHSHLFHTHHHYSI